MALKYVLKYEYVSEIGDKKIKFRQWSANEEKNYLSVIENGEKATDKMVYDILIRPCLEEDIVLSVSEQKKLLIDIRRKSISETFKDKIICKHCKAETEKEIDLEEIMTYTKSNYKNVTVDKITFVFGEIKSNKDKERLSLEKGVVNYIYTDFLLHIHEIIVDGEKNNNFTFEELEEYMSSLPSKIFDEVFEEYQKMIDDLELVYEFKCPSCNKTEKIDYTNIPGFLWI